MVSNKENRSAKPKTEGEKHQGVGINPEKKHASASGDEHAKQKPAASEKK
ncbi:hypothetical protein BH10PSE7_BH10PSE7_44570 [soil metagenome]